MSNTLNGYISETLVREKRTTTNVGNALLLSDNMRDNDTLELFSRLISQIQPATLQDELKALIDKHGVR